MSQPTESNMKKGAATWGLTASIVAGITLAEAIAYNWPAFYGVALFCALGAVRWFIQEAR